MYLTLPGLWEGVATMASLCPASQITETRQSLTSQKEAVLGLVSKKA